MPSICPCNCNEFALLEKLDKNIYDIESTETFLSKFFDVVEEELCDVLYAKEMAKNDFYLWKDVVDEAVIKGVHDGKDCFSCKTVVEIISVGDTPGASDYTEGIDFSIDVCGISWTVAPHPYYGYPQPYNPYHIIPKQPETGATYYVTYRCGVRNEKLYSNFGVLVNLVKKNSQTYVDYRHAIKALIEAYLLGPTIAGMKKALSTMIDEDYIYIEEGYKIGWVLGESYLYSPEDYADPTLYTADGTIFGRFGESDFEFDVYVYHSDLVDDKVLFEDIVNKIRPAHTIAYLHWF